MFSRTLPILLNTERAVKNLDGGEVIEITRKAEKPAEKVRGWNGL